VTGTHFEDIGTYILPALKIRDLQEGYKHWTGRNKNIIKNIRKIKNPVI